MTEEILDSGSAGQGAKEDGTSQASPQQNVKPNLGDIDTFVTALLEHDGFNQALSRATQAQKDRRFQKLENKQRTFEEQLAEYQELTTGEGAVSPAVAMKLMNLSPAEAQVTVDAQAQAKETGQPKLVYDAVLTSMNLEPNDPAVREILAAGGDYATTIQSFATLANAKAQASAAQAASPAVGTLPGTGGGQASGADLEAQYRAEANKVRQGDITGLEIVKQKYRKLGLQVY